MAGLRSCPGRREDPALAAHAPQDPALADPGEIAQGDVERRVPRDPLQPVHVVRHRGAAGRLLLDTAVPAGPGSSPAGQGLGAGAERGVVPLVRELAQDRGLDGGRAPERLQRPVGMAGEDRVVEKSRPPFRLSITRTPSLPRWTAAARVRHAMLRAKGLDSFCTYRLEPPRMTRQAGRPFQRGIPWFARNSTTKRIGNFLNFPGGTDRRAEPGGVR